MIAVEKKLPEHHKCICKFYELNNCLCGFVVDELNPHAVKCNYIGCETQYACIPYQLSIQLLT
ncbi:hypothetical protein BDQ17DRAFT_1340742 [Cyathus striatus]|nr:hypothetical protein BDQ17DRAFT_1340742 [Cyathus striatus]